MSDEPLNPEEVKKVRQWLMDEEMRRRSREAAVERLKVVNTLILSVSAILGAVAAAWYAVIQAVAERVK